MNLCFTYRSRRKYPCCFFFVVVVVQHKLLRNLVHFKIKILSQTVVTVFWARVLCHLVVEEARFWMRVTLGVNLIRSLVFTKHVPGRLRSGSGMALN